MEPLTVCLDWIRVQLDLVDSDPNLSLPEFYWRQRCAIELYNELKEGGRDFILETSPVFRPAATPAGQTAHEQQDHDGEQSHSQLCFAQ